MAEKKYVSDNAQLMAQWYWEKKQSKNPSQLTVGSNIKVWWIGNCVHHWEAHIQSRNHGRGCPTCTGKIVQQGVNDLHSTQPAGDHVHRPQGGLIPLDEHSRQAVAAFTPYRRAYRPPGWENCGQGE